MPERVYTGREPTNFVADGIGRVEAGDRFDVPADRLAAYDGRADIAVPAPEYEADVAQAEEKGRAEGEAEAGIAPDAEVAEPPVKGRRKGA